MILRLNIGCGSRRLAGYTGVDVVKRSAVDIIAPANKIPLKSGTVDEIMAIHLVEHVFRWETPQLLKEWSRLLKPGGLLVLELPDLIKCCRNVLSAEPDQMGLWGIYGNDRTEDPLMSHRTGWTFSTLKPLVEEAGFRDITEHETVFHGVGRKHRDFRLEARRLANA